MGWIGENKGVKMRGEKNLPVILSIRLIYKQQQSHFLHIPFWVAALPSQRSGLEAWWFWAAILPSVADGDSPSTLPAVQLR